MGPMAGRYGDEIEKPNQRIAQPGSYDIHGVFAGMTWDINEINLEEGFIELRLPAEVWKNEIKNYYYFAAQDSFETERYQSLQRLIRATRRRYKDNPEVIKFLNDFDCLLKIGI